MCANDRKAASPLAKQRVRAPETGRQRPGESPTPSDDCFADQVLATARERARRLRNGYAKLRVHDDQALSVTCDDATRKAQLREAILHYVREHSLAADTADGILACWLPDKRFEDAPEHIEAVLEALVAEQCLCPYPLPDGNVLYVSNALKCFTSQQTS